MKKALQIAALRAQESVSERSVGSRSCEAQLDGFRDVLAQVRIGNPGGKSSRLRRVFGRRTWQRRRAFRSRLDTGLRQRSDDELQARRCEVPEPLADRPFELGELETPCRRARVDDERPVAADTCGQC